jgi:NAD(P)H-flavin reductase/hemoglobin-like flavoprotein
MPRPHRRTVPRLFPGSRTEPLGEERRATTPLLADANQPPPAAPPLISFGAESGQPPPSPLPEPQQLNPAVIRGSLASMTIGSQQCASDFYGYLFTAAPRLRNMFPPEMHNQNERLFAALLKIVELLDTPDALARYLSQLGADHRKFGVRPEHYAPVGQALLKTLRRHCPRWGDAEEAAWATAYAVASEAMVAGAEQSSGPAYWTGHVVQHERRNRDLAVLKVQVNEPLPYLAGQYVSVQTHRWQRMWRSFSIANAPMGDRNLIELHVRAITGGWVSTSLVRDTGPDDEIIIGPPVGTMTAETVGDRDLLLVAGGTGLAPLKAVVEEVLAADERAVAEGTGFRRNIQLFHGARTPLGLYDMPYLHELAMSYPWLQVVPVVSEEPKFSGLCGSVSEVALEYSDWYGREVFVAGPEEMTKRAVRGLREAGISGEQVHFDDLAFRVGG